MPSEGETIMIYKQLVQNKIGHRYHQFIEQTRKISEPADVPAKKDVGAVKL